MRGVCTLQERASRRPNSQPTKHLLTAERVAMWLAVTKPNEAWAQWVHATLVPHLQMLRTDFRGHQSRGAAVAASLSLGHAPEPMPDPVELLGWLEECKDSALALSKSELGPLQGKPGVSLSLASALAVRDASMGCFGMGHTALSQRGSVLWSIKAPQYAQQPCRHQNCPMPGTCCGNLLQRIARRRQDMPQGCPVPTYQLVVPHHKNSTRGGAQVGSAIFMTDAKEIELMDIYLAHARPTLTFVEGDEAVESLFVKHSGQPFDDSGISSWWTKMYK